MTRGQALHTLCCFLVALSSLINAGGFRQHATHPILANEGVLFGLPDSCLTYADRYRDSFETTSVLDTGCLIVPAGACIFAQGLNHQRACRPAKRANTPQGHHNFAVISWGLWFGQEFAPDLIASLRALAIEGHAAGFDVWFLYRVSFEDLRTTYFTVLFLSVRGPRANRCRREAR